MTDCLVCATNALETLPRRESIVRTEHWRAAHAFGTSLPGWLVLVPTTHLTSLAELSPAAAGELGPLLQRLTAALVQVTGCSKTYVMLLAEQEGFSHVHFHVVPRQPDLPEALRGPNIFGLLGVEDELPESARDAMAVRLVAALQT